MLCRHFHNISLHVLHYLREEIEETYFANGVTGSAVLPMKRRGKLVLFAAGGSGPKIILA